MKTISILSMLEFLLLAASAATGLLGWSLYYEGHEVIALLLGLASVDLFSTVVFKKPIFGKGYFAQDMYPEESDV